MAPPRGHMVYIGLYREKHEKILSETTRPRALMFGMKHHLVNLYQVCSSEPLPSLFKWSQKWPRTRLTCFTYAFIGEKHEKIFS